MPECSHCFFRQRDQTLEIDTEMQADVARLEAVRNRKLCSSANFSKVNLLITSDVSSAFVVNKTNMAFGDGLSVDPVYMSLSRPTDALLKSVTSRNSFDITLVEAVGWI